MPPKSKSKNAPNQHDKRHESGLAPPGKRVSKKHSNGHLNGQPNGTIAADSPPPALPSTGISSALNGPRPAGPANPAGHTKDHAVSSEGTERDRAYSDASLDEAAPCGEMGDAYQEPASSASGVEAPAAAYTRSINGSHAARTLPGISTLLTCYPLRDAISILILLLSLPPTLVLVIQTLFTSLTFVPPTVNISLSTLPNVKEIFNSSNFGYPALATILIVDLIFWVCWLPVWKPIQAVFLDLSQAVIAVSLSGAAASTGGPTYSIATCTTIVCIVHVLRYKAIHLTALDYLRSVLQRTDAGTPLDVPSFAANFIPSPPVDRGWVYTVIRTILGIHIVSQGVTTCIRRSLVKANEQTANVPAIIRSESEIISGADANPRPSAGDNHVAATSTDGRPPGPPPAARDNRARETTSRKKRKQVNHIRSQQPLWAAIASTKVTFVKEMEQRDAADDAREAARMDTDTSTFVGRTNDTTNRIWISEVRDSEIFFSIDLSAEAAMESTANLEDGRTVSAGIDRSKPFYVRINGAAWSSTRMTMTTTEDDFINSSGKRYDGEIFGLAPLSSYSCEVVGIASQKVHCSVSIITQPAPTAEQAASASSQPAHQSLRPSSPITTLKQSIQQAEAKLNETRNRGKKSKKDQRAVLADLKRDINNFKAKLESSGGSDDKQEKRLVQLNQHKSQADEAAAELKQQIDALGGVPDDELVESEGTRHKWKSASDAKYAAGKDFDNAKADAEREQNAMKSDITSTESKREKLAARLLQRTQELEKLISKQQADMTAKQRRDLDRAQALQRREEEENQFRFHINTFEAEAQRFHEKAQDAYQEMASLQSWSTQPPPYPGLSSPPTPENAVAGPNGSISAPQSNGFPPFGAPSFQPSFHTAQPSISTQVSAPRGRSSSMLSQYSGFTENGEEYFFPRDQPRPQYTWPLQGNASTGALHAEDHKDSEGSGSSSLTSGSTSSNSPRPDAKTFIPGKPVGPIAPPGKSKVSQSPG